MPLRDLLEELHDSYNRPQFIRDDPIRVPHRYAARADREISGFLTATIAWGNRRAIVTSAERLMDLMDDRPAEFVLHASETELRALQAFAHRTFNGEDLVDFIRSIRMICERHGGIGRYFESRYEATESIKVILSEFRREFFRCAHTRHSEKHVSSVDRGSACKRLNLYLRWFVRHDDRGVDFGLWRRIPMSALYLPLDVHSARTGRNLGLLTRGQNDWKAVEEITANLRRLDPDDPVRYDFALFGAGLDGRA